MQKQTQQSMGSSKTDDWGTPPEVLDPIYEHMGGIALDPASNLRSIVRCTKALTIVEDGLAHFWHEEVKGLDGLVYVNPPYGNKVKTWVKKAVAEANEGVEIVMLTAARVDTKWFHEIFDSADAICFWKGRLKFINLRTLERTDPAFFPSALAYWGDNVDRFYEAFDDKGHIMVPKHSLTLP